VLWLTSGLCLQRLGTAHTVASAQANELRGAVEARLRSSELSLEQARPQDALLLHAPPRTMPATGRHARGTA